MDRATNYDYSHGKPLKHQISLAKEGLKLRKYVSWQAFINDLIINNLFSIPDKLELNTEILKDNPQTSIGSVGDGCRPIMELKIYDGYRSIELLHTYYPEPNNVKDYIYSKNIIQIFNDLQLDYYKTVR